MGLKSFVRASYSLRHATGHKSWSSEKLAWKLNLGSWPGWEVLKSPGSLKDTLSGQKVWNLESLLARSKDRSGAVRGKRVVSFVDESRRDSEKWGPIDLMWLRTTETSQVEGYLRTGCPSWKCPSRNWHTKGCDPTLLESTLGKTAEKAEQ